MQRSKGVPLYGVWHRGKEMMENKQWSAEMSNYGISDTTVIGEEEEVDQLREVGNEFCDNA